MHGHQADIVLDGGLWYLPSSSECPRQPALGLIARHLRARCPLSTLAVLVIYRFVLLTLWGLGATDLSGAVKASACSQDRELGAGVLGRIVRMAVSR